MEINQPNAQQEAEQKQYKFIKDKMKEQIKEVSNDQIEVNKDCKTCTGTKQSMAQQAAHLNAVDLRHLFIAYAIFRQPNTQRDIPEQNYTYNVATGKIVRKDGKAITNQENAPNMDLVNKILDKHGARSKTASVNKV